MNKFFFFIVLLFNQTQTFAQEIYEVNYNWDRRKNIQLNQVMAPTFEKNNIIVLNWSVDNLAIFKSKNNQDLAAIIKSSGVKFVSFNFNDSLGVIKNFKLKLTTGLIEKAQDVKSILDAGKSYLNINQVTSPWPSEYPIGWSYIDTSGAKFHSLNIDDLFLRLMSSKTQESIEK